MFNSKCRNNNTEYYYIQWNWNIVDITNFCGKDKISFTDKLEGKLILYGLSEMFNQKIDLGDYLVKDYKGNITVYREEDFDKLFEILED